MIDCYTNASGQIVSTLLSLFSIMAFAQGPWVILFSRYRGSCLSPARRLSYASVQSASGELSGFILNCILLLVAAVGFDGLE